VAGYTCSMSTFFAREFFNLDSFEHAALFPDEVPVWEALGRAMDTYLTAWHGWEILSHVPAGVHILGGAIFVDRDCVIEPGAVLRGPLIVGAGTEIRTGAYLRGRVIVGRNCIVGAHSELKTAILLDGARAPHQNYVGDSILGSGVNLGAGTILSNVKNVGKEVSFRAGGDTIHTGLKKLGAILGDGCRTGCNSVLNPGVLMGPGCITYPNVCLRSGFYPARTLIKLRQTQQQVVLDRLDLD
jgi:UDP-N-acetylglucosamine diphosphorylase / glucose-1-phosphate thymidylyltransferase / UDP-N-acetylgalactosamine diphosphorylase / glucosamine-1-phosphate N-acetyltransferase / galactosamine-1-phosphate N-acetyltransferase